MLLPIVQYNNFVSHIFLQKENLRRIGGRVMRHRVHIVDKFQQHPDGKDNTLVWLAQMVQPQIIPITYIGDPLFPFEVTDNFFRCIRR